MAGTITLGGQTLASHDTASNTSSIVVDQLTSPIMNAAQLKTNGIEFNNSGLVLTKFETGTFQPQMIAFGPGAYRGSSNDYIDPYPLSESYYTRIGNLVYINIPATLSVPQDEIAIYVYQNLPFEPTRTSLLTCGLARGAQWRYADSIESSKLAGPIAYANKGKYISFAYERTDQDYSGYIYIPTASGSNLPSISGFYMTDEE